MVLPQGVQCCLPLHSSCFPLHFNIHIYVLVISLHYQYFEGYRSIYAFYVKLIHGVISDKHNELVNISL